MLILPLENSSTLTVSRSKSQAEALPTPLVLLYLARTNPQTRQYIIWSNGRLSDYVRFQCHIDSAMVVHGSKHECNIHPTGWPSVERLKFILDYISA